MNRLTALGSAMACAAVLLVTTNTAEAAPPTATDLVADCNEESPGRVDVTGRTVFRTGSAVLNQPCVLVTESNSTLVLRDITLTGSGSLIITTGTASANVKVKVIDSNITLGGDVQLSAGDVAGDALVPEENGTVVVRNSTVIGSTVDIGASFDWPGGRVVLRNSLVEATAGEIVVGASELGGTDGVIRVRDTTLRATGNIRLQTGTDFPSGDRGRVRVVDSTLDAGGSLRVDSGPNGRTVVRRTAVSGSPLDITTGAGGTCRAVGLTPATACT